MTNQFVTFSYVNYRGEVSERKVWPIRIFFGSNKWHSEEQWLMDAHDFTSVPGGEVRTFAMKDINGWKAVPR